VIVCVWMAAYYCKIPVCQSQKVSAGFSSTDTAAIWIKRGEHNKHKNLVEYADAAWKY